MKILKLEQGSQEWLDARLEHFCASEAPVIMGASKFMTRRQLLDLKKGWQSNPDDNSFRQKLFARGHEHEDLAREHIEFDIMADLPPVVGSIKFRGVKAGILASFDGYNEGLPMAWEHKDWNEALAENVRNNTLEPHYYWQLEHQCWVAGAKEVTFTCSDGSIDKRVSMVYQSQPARQKELKAAWKQFEKDLDAHELEAKDSVSVEAETINLPVLVAEVTGTEISTNIKSVITEFTSLAHAEIAKPLETDLDFANKDSLNKLVKNARDKLKAKVADVREGFASFSEFSAYAEELDSILQKMQSDGEKKVKAEKDRRKNAIIEIAKSSLVDTITAAYKQIEPLNPELIAWSTSQINWTQVAKNKRTLDSIQSAADDAVAEYKAQLQTDLDQIVPNLEWLKAEADEYRFLFADVEQFINQLDMSFKAICKTRISEHQAAEAKRIEDQKAEEAANAAAIKEAPVTDTHAKDVEQEIQEQAIEATGQLAPVTSISDRVIVTDDSDGVITFSDGKEFTLPDFAGDGPMTVVEKLSQMARTIVNEYKAK